MTERARGQWRNTPRWHLRLRLERREHYLGWQRKLDELHAEAERHRNHVHWALPKEMS